MSQSLFYSVDASIIALLLVAVMMAAGEIGYRVGLHRQRRVGDSGRGHFGAVQGSILGLVALLLGFTFSLSSQRYEARRQLLMADANVLGALSLQSAILPDAERVVFKRTLREYLEVRTQADLLHGDLALERLPERIQHTDELHARMWAQMCSLATRQPPVVGSDAMLSLLREASAINRQRIYAFLGRVPLAVMALLFAAALIAMSAVGLVGGLGKYRGMTARTLLAILLGGTVFIILDLDQPRHGLIQIDQTPLLRVKAAIESDPEAASVSAAPAAQP